MRACLRRVHVVASSRLLAMKHKGVQARAQLLAPAGSWTSARGAAALMAGGGGGGGGADGRFVIDGTVLRISAPHSREWFGDFFIKQIQKCHEIK